MPNSAITQQVQGLATTTSPGLVGTGAQTLAGKKTFDGGALIKGDTSGVAIASGYVGQKITWINPPITQTFSTVEADWVDGSSNPAQIVLTAGVWLVTANIAARITTGTTAGNDSYIRVRITDSSNNLIQNMDKLLSTKTPANAELRIWSVLPFSFVAVLSAASTTYKIRGSRGDNNGVGVGGLFNEPAFYSEFFAIRIA